MSQSGLVGPPPEDPARPDYDPPLPGETPCIPARTVRTERTILSTEFTSYPLYTLYDFGTAIPLPAVFNPASPTNTLLSYNPDTSSFLAFIISSRTFRVVDDSGTLPTEVTSLRHPVCPWPWLLTQLGVPQNTATASSVFVNGYGWVYQVPDGWIPIPVVPVLGDRNLAVVGASRNGNECLVASRRDSGFFRINHSLRTRTAINLSIRRYPVSMMAARAQGLLAGPASSVDAATLAALRAENAALRAQLAAAGGTGTTGPTTGPPALAGTRPPTITPPHVGQIRAWLQFQTNGIPGSTSVRLANRNQEPTTGVALRFDLRPATPSSAWSLTIVQSGVVIFGRQGSTAFVFPEVPTDVLNFLNGLNLPWWLSEAPSL